MGYVPELSHVPMAMTSNKLDPVSRAVHIFANQLYFLYIS